MSALHPANDIVDRGIALHKVREITCCRLYFADSTEVQGFSTSLSYLKFDRIHQTYFSDLASPFLFAHSGFCTNFLLSLLRFFLLAPYVPFFNPAGKSVHYFLSFAMSPIY
jgi:hypothetical protein